MRMSPPNVLVTKLKEKNSLDLLTGSDRLHFTNFLSMQLSVCNTAFGRQATMVVQENKMPIAPNYTAILNSFFSEIHFIFPRPSNGILSLPDTHITILELAWILNSPPQPPSNSTANHLMTFPQGFLKLMF